MTELNSTLTMPREDFLKAVKDTFREINENSKIPGYPTDDMLFQLYRTIDSYEAAQEHASAPAVDAAPTPKP